MRVLVVGGSGFVGSAVVARLACEGHEAFTVSRGVAPHASARHTRLDIGRALRPEDWLTALAGAEA
jgi:GDP-L-fucose synthase